jgi:hypothetical protein
LDPSDPSYSITVILPEVPLCTLHSQAAREGELLIGWCDDERCRTYGEIGAMSPCGKQYERLPR